MPRIVPRRAPAAAPGLTTRRAAVDTAVGRTADRSLPFVEAASPDAGFVATTISQGDL